MHCIGSLYNIAFDDTQVLMSSSSTLKHECVNCVLVLFLNPLSPSPGIPLRKNVCPGGCKPPNQVTTVTDCHCGHMIGCRSHWLPIMTIEQELSMRAWPLCWEHTVSAISEQKPWASINAYVWRVIVKGHPL